MALLWADSFDHYGTGATGITNSLQGPWGVMNGNTSINATRPRTGANAMEMVWTPNATVMASRTIPSSDKRVGVGFGFYLNALPANDNYISARFKNSITNIVSIYFSAGGAILAYIGSHTGTLVASSDNGIITASAYNYVEFSMLRDSVVGEIEVRVNGQVVIFVNNLNLGALNGSTFAFEKGVNGAGPTGYVDDIVCWDGAGTTNNTFIGPVRISTIYPTGNTAEADWSVNTGSAYAAIDDTVPDGDTTYIMANTAGMVSEFSISGLPSEVEQVAAVYVPAMSRLAGAGVGNLQVSLVSDGNVAAGVDRTITATYTYWGDVFPLDPDGNISWTKTSIEASLLRVEKTV